MPRSALPLLIALFAGCSLASRGATGSAADDSGIRVDHIMLGAGDLERAINEFETATGVRPEYGGKHPTGTHNALVSLGNGTYLELIAPQVDAKPTTFTNELAKLGRLTPIGWAVSAAEAHGLRQRLVNAGFAVTSPEPGSRIKPSGATLRWQTFGLNDELQGAPFFIAWAPESPHPSSTSPGGCTLERLTVASPESERLARLLAVLDLRTEVANARQVQFTLSLACPKGMIILGPDRQQSQQAPRRT